MQVLLSFMLEYIFQLSFSLIKHPSVHTVGLNLKRNNVSVNLLQQERLERVQSDTD